MKKVVIIILHYLGEEYTKLCLESVEKIRADGLKIEAMVVNNNPKEDLTDIKKEYSRFLFLETGENLGYVGGNNYGITRALRDGADYILVLNNDTIVDKSLILELVKAAESEKAAVIGPKIYFAKGFEYHKKRYKPADLGKVIWYAGGKIDWKNVNGFHRGVDEVDRGQYELSGATDFVTGCAVFIKRQVFETIGLFDERYFLYLEDLEFCQRAMKAGFKIIFAPKAKLWHYNAGSSKVGGGLHDYYITRNRLLFGLNYAPFITRYNLIQESIKLWIFGRPWQKIAVKDYYTGRLGKGSWHD
jgi:GT2 family glycosyltransferase